MAAPFAYDKNRRLPIPTLRFLREDGAVDQAGVPDVRRKLGVFPDR